jgi:GH25 family lysozyme M1 (1,4-beta-N-acetylmuramidase)
MLLAFDISAFQGTGHDFAQAKAAGYVLALNRASDGLGITTTGLSGSVDTCFATNVAAERAAGLEIGAYHVADFSKSALDQAHLFLSVVGASFIGLAVLDVEPYATKQGTPAQINAWIAQFNTVVSAALGHPVITYMDAYMYGWLGKPKVNLWEADSGVPQPADPCLLWQCGQGDVPGVGNPVDLDKWMGDLLSLHTYTGEIMQNIPVNAQPVAIMSTSTGKGYRIVCADGGVFDFGDAQFLGSEGGTTLAAPITAAATTPDGNGYWLLGKDGGVFAFGDAEYLGRVDFKGPYA